MDTTQIRVYTTTKAKIDKMKGKLSSASYVDGMVYYFEMTGLTPQSMRAHPSQELKDGIERVVKIIRNIEKTKIDETLNLVRKFFIEKIAVGEGRGDGFKKEEVAAMLEYKDALEKKLSISKQQYDTLNKRIKDAYVELKKIISEDSETVAIVERSLDILTQKK
jgi:vacuolar-type H+-ATPase subunit I/STV1